MASCSICDDSPDPQLDCSRCGYKAPRRPAAKLKCLRIVYLNGDVEVRHNVTAIVQDLLLRYWQICPHVGKHLWFVCYRPVRGIFVTPQDTLRS